MSETRLPDEVLTHKMLENRGKKQGGIYIKYELFSAVQFAKKWDPMEDSFYPKPPLQGSARMIFWARHFRVRVNGKWLSDAAKYTLYTKDEIGAMMGFRG